jgi:hypothetical protein
MPVIRRNYLDLPKNIAEKIEKAHKARLGQGLSDPNIAPEQKTKIKEKLEKLESQKKSK